MVSYRRLAMRVLGHVPVPFGKKKASPPPRVAAQRIAALALACAMMTGMTLPAFAATYDIVSGSIDIHATENGNLISQWNWNDENQKEYVSDSSGDIIKDRLDNEITITGTSTGNTVTIDADKDQTANVTLKDVNINVDEKYEHGYDPDQYKTAVEVTGSGNTNIELNGNNTLTSGYGHAGLEHNKTDDSGTLTIQDEKNDDGSAKGSASDTTGSLTATGGYHSAGIGGSDKQDGQVTITGGEITANGGNQGAGIGGGAGDTDAVGGDGDVTISGGTITATGGSLGAGIGGGAYGNGTVTVTDGDITAKATGDYGAGIGGGFGAIPKDTLIGGNGTVTISGGTITEASGGYMAAGIGSGYQGLGTVTIEGDAVIKNAQGGEAGAGIGSGTYGDSEIIIRGDAVIENAESSANGAGIGSGQGDLYPDGMVIDPTVGNVTIEGNAKIENAKSGSGGSGIGGGTIGIGNVIIRGNAQIGNATGGEEGAGIGGGALGTGDVTIEGNVTIENAQGGAGAAGIGGGAETEPDTEDTRNKVSIKSTEAGSPNITATGGGVLNDENYPLAGAAAIGSGSVADGATEVKSDITIEGKVTIDATAGGSIAIGDALTGEQKFAGLPVGAVITRKDSNGKDLTQEGDKPTEPEKPEPEKPEPEKPEPEKPEPEKPDPEKPEPEKPEPEKPDPEKPEPEKPEPEKPDPENPEPEKPNPEQPNPNPENPNPNPENPNPNPEQPSEPSGAVSTSAPAEELTASDAEYLVTVEGLYVTNALEKQITHSCTQNVQGKVLTIRANSIVATAHLTMNTLRTLKAQGVETIRFCTLLYRPTSVSIDALLNLGVDEADILWTHNGIQARLTVGGTDSSSLLQ